MTNATQFSLANRKQLSDLLADKYDSLRQRTRDKFRAKERQLREALIKEYAEKKGVTALTAQIAAAEAKIQELNGKLEVLGFELERDGSLDLRSSDSNPIRKTIDERVEKQLGTWSAIEARFDSAQVAMMTVASLEDAEKLLKAVQEI